MKGIGATPNGGNGEVDPYCTDGKYGWHGSCDEKADKAAGVLSPPR